DLVSAEARLRRLNYVQSEASTGLRNEAASADLVVASYVVGEMNADRQAALADLMWAATRDTLLVVEPGTPAGYQRILDLRRRLIAQGAHVLAPCPHNGECPLMAFSREENASKEKATDWCH